MRAVAARFHDRGFYTLSLRMQGHGTVPGGLVNTDWEDWMAAVTMGARQVRTGSAPTGRWCSSATPTAARS